ncbi:MAG: tryptophan 7-halogenase [Planctomycetales bacterium]|nr:tryptophan 7-halogenase [Planctomycetales bacterium]
MIKPSESSIAAYYDVIVVGAGPAGSSTATLTAEHGLKTLLVEREAMPRFHVGESLMPETYWALQRLGVLERMKECGFVSKVGVQFVTSAGRESQPFYFEENDPRECSRTWHVERSKFDEMLFHNAAEKGADCCDQTRVMDFDQQTNADGVRNVVLRNRDGQNVHSSCKVIVDATGQSTFIANRLGLRQENRDLRKASIWSYFQGADRVPDGRNTTIILHTNDKSAWFWYIPLANDIVSVGVVADNDYLLRNRGTSEQTFAEELNNCDAVAQRLKNAKRVDKFHAAKEFSYWTSQHAGDGWVLVGDALGFIDPVYSSGVFLALKSGELAADAIAEGFQKNDLSGEQLGNWTAEFKSGVVWIRKLVHAFYNNEFSFGSFMKQFPHYKGNLTNLLIGRVFDEGVGAIFDDLDPVLAKSQDSTN